MKNVAMNKSKRNANLSRSISYAEEEKPQKNDKSSPNPLDHEIFSQDQDKNKDHNFSGLLQDE